jgi:hypothetical protein
MFERESIVEINLVVKNNGTLELHRIADTIRNLLYPLEGVEVKSIWSVREELLGELSKSETTR